jgi:hypothetical protein
MPLQLRLRARAAVLLTAASAAALAGCSAHANSAAREGNEKFVLRSDASSLNPVYAATASGVFSASGTFPGIGDGRDRSMARFSDGTFIVTHLAKDQKTTVQQVDSRTCAMIVDQTGPYTIGGGTGAYRGITGYGTDTADFTGTLPRRNGKCDTSPTAIPVKGTAHAVIVARGAILLPPS